MFPRSNSPSRTNTNTNTGHGVVQNKKIGSPLLVKSSSKPSSKPSSTATKTLNMLTSPLHRSSYLRKLARSYNTNKSNNKEETHESVVVDDTSSPSVEFHTLAMSHNSDHGAEITDNEGAPPRITSTSSSTSDLQYANTNDGILAANDLHALNNLLSEEMKDLISGVFSAISSLEASYPRLQSAAHIIHPDGVTSDDDDDDDDDDLHMADRAVMRDIRNLSELKKSYFDRLSRHSNQSMNSISISIPASASPNKNYHNENNLMILKSYEGLINNFHTEIQEKNAAIESLKDMVAQTTLQKEKVERKLKKVEQRLQHRRVSTSVNVLCSRPPNMANNTKNVVMSSSAVPSSNGASEQLDWSASYMRLLRACVAEAGDASTSFTELLTSLMKMAGWDLDAAARSIEPHLPFARRSHSKLAFEAYLWRRMLTGFESENFGVDGSLPTEVDPEKRRAQFYADYEAMKDADPAAMVGDEPHRLFSRFCLKKFEEVVHPRMEEAFFGGLEKHRETISMGKHPNTPFYHCFLQAAKAIWRLHSLRFSHSPAPRIFQAPRDADFSPAYMESVIGITTPVTSNAGNDDDDDDDDDDDVGGAQNGENEKAKIRVGFTVMPGFLLLGMNSNHMMKANNIIKCQVYPFTVLPSTSLQEGQHS